MFRKFLKPERMEMRFADYQRGGTRFKKGKMLIEEEKNMVTRS